MSHLPKLFASLGPGRSADRSAPVLVLLAALMLALGFVVSPGLFTIDEFIYSLGSHAVLNHAGFAIENGWSGIRSEDLSLWLLVEGPAGLTPQYPAGHAVLGAPLLRLFGERGLLLLNVLAGIGLIFATRALAERLYPDRTSAILAIALLFGATFWLEYVYAVWPHAVSTLCVTIALICALDFLDDEPGSDLKAVAAGAAVGIGLLFRTDSILAIPAVGLMALLFAKRPLRSLAFVGLGLLPFAALTSAANYAKFGTLNPLTYGPTTGGATSLGAHLMPAAALALVSLLLVAWRLTGWRPGKPSYALGLVAIVVILAFSETMRDFARDYLFGAWALVVDSTVIPDSRRGMEALPGGLLSFWGLWKKALGQSMPWLGLLFLALHQPADKRLRRSQLIVLILVAVWSLPFFMRAWHGGMSSNMRYFLPIVPALCALSAKVLIDFCRTVANAKGILLAGALSGFCALFIWTRYHPTHLAGAQQILSTYLFLAVACLALMSGLGWAARRHVQVLALTAIGAAFAVSTVFLTLDFAKAQSFRAKGERMSMALSDLPDDALVYAPARFLTRWAIEPGHVAALPSQRDGSFDYTLIDHALRNGHRVLVWPSYANAALRDRYGPRLGRSGIEFPGGELLEVRPAAPR